MVQESRSGDGEQTPRGRGRSEDSRGQKKITSGGFLRRTVSRGPRSAAQHEEERLREAGYGMHGVNVRPTRSKMLGIKALQPRHDLPNQEMKP